jgi:hypothetical protein
MDIHTRRLAKELHAIDRTDGELVRDSRPKVSMHGIVRRVAALSHWSHPYEKVPLCEHSMWLSNIMAYRSKK